MKRKKKTEKKDTVKKKTKKNKKVSSTRVLINTKTITDYSLKLFNGEEVVFFVVQPQNLSVMSKENIGAKIFALTNVVKGLNDIEIICLNSDGAEVVHTLPELLPHSFGPEFLGL